MHLFSYEVTTTVVWWLELRPGERFLGEGWLSPIREHITPSMCAKLGFRLLFFVKHISIVYRPHNCFAINLNVPLVGLFTLFQFACYIDQHHPRVHCTPSQMVWCRQLLLSQIFLFAPLCSHRNGQDGRRWETKLGIDLSILWRQCQSFSIYPYSLHSFWVLVLIWGNRFG